MEPRSGQLASAGVGPNASDQELALRLAESAHDWKVLQRTYHVVIHGQEWDVTVKKCLSPLEEEALESQG